MYASFRTHYKEYLVDKINKAKLDPITIYETVKIALILTREEMDVPGKEEEDGVEEDEADYRERLIKVGATPLPKLQLAVCPSFCNILP